MIASDSFSGRYQDLLDGRKQRPNFRRGQKAPRFEVVVEHLAERVAEMLGTSYTSRQAGYDLKKLRGKGLIEKIEDRDPLDKHYQVIRDEMEEILQELNIAA